MKQKIKVMLSILMCCTILFSLTAVLAEEVDVQATKTITENQTGTFEGYDYEYWKDRGTGTMTLTGGATYSCSWSNINNILFRTGKKLGSTKYYQDYNGIKIDYECDYKPNGNSYMAVYGWTKDPLVEYYIIDSYGTWNPGSQSQKKGSATIDGRTYDIYSNSRTGPSILGDNTTFQQYWSICTSKVTKGTITVSDHFKAWEKAGMKMGKLYEVSMNVEGYQSSGSANMKKMDLTFGDTTTTPTDPTTPVTERSAFGTLEAESYNSSNSTTIKSIGTDNGGSGVGYIENGNYLVFNKINFGSGASSFKAHVANGNTTDTTIQLRTGSPTGTVIGSLVVPGTGGWDTYKDLSTTVSGASSVQDLYLCFNGPVNFDSFSFGTGTTPTDPGTTIQLGDVDGSGDVTALDIAIYKQYLLGLTTSLPKAGDVDQNGTMDAIDFAKIKQHLLGTITLGKI